MCHVFGENKIDHFSLLKTICGAFGGSVHSNGLIVLSIEPFYRTSPQFWGGSIEHPPPHFPDTESGWTFRRAWGLSLGNSAAG